MCLQCRIADGLFFQNGISFLRLASLADRGGPCLSPCLWQTTKKLCFSSIRLLFGLDPEIRIVGEAVNFRQTLQRATDLKPQIVLMDLHMPDDLGLSPQEIKSQLDRLGSRLIAMSFWNDEDTQALARNLGAVVLLDKMRLVSELIPAIKAATGHAKKRERLSSWEKLLEPHLKRVLHSSIRLPYSESLSGHGCVFDHRPLSYESDFPHRIFGGWKIPELSELAALAALVPWRSWNEGLP